MQVFCSLEHIQPFTNQLLTDEEEEEEPNVTNIFGRVPSFTSCSTTTEVVAIISRNRRGYYVIRNQRVYDNFAMGDKIKLITNYAFRRNFALLSEHCCGESYLSSSGYITLIPTLIQVSVRSMEITKLS